MKITPTNITKLKANEIFVFGSNLNGAHIGGAAKLALDKFGAINGQAIGLQGKSYAVPSLDKQMLKQNIWDIQEHVKDLLSFIKIYAKQHFLITEIGCGIAGFTHAEIAPLFKDFLTVENCSLPQAFLDLIQPIKGYKVTDSKMRCLSMQYELNKIFEHEGSIEVCDRGFHYCPELKDCFQYYTFTTENRVFEILDHGKPLTNGDKNCTNKIEFIRELSWLEVTEKVNLGKGNTGISNAGNDNAGYRNAGNDNAGNYNAGYRNAGNDNAGYRNAGNYNAGNYNAGNSNAGYRNAGNYNAGNYNAGNSNAGNYNAGNYNAGYRNAGYSNAGNDNAGAFNNLDNQPYMLFNKPSTWTYNDFIDSKAYSYLQQVNTTIWVADYQMTEQEKTDYPYYITTGGFVRNIPYKEAFANSWNNWSETARQSFKDLPNFDKSIFEEITSIRV